MNSEPTKSLSETLETPVVKIVELARSLAKPSCKRCYGRGYVGVGTIGRSQNSQIVLCPCVRRATEKIRMAHVEELKKEQEQCLTAQA